MPEKFTPAAWFTLGSRLGLAGILLWVAGWCARNYRATRHQIAHLRAARTAFLLSSTGYIGQPKDEAGHTPPTDLFNQLTPQKQGGD